MINIKVAPDKDVLLAYQDTARRLPTLTARAFQRQAQRVRAKWLPILRTQPGRPSYPIRWKSARQRRAFFATNGFGRGIPTVRTNALTDGYDIIYETDGYEGFVAIINTTSYARFVVGDDAQPFHLDTGWQQTASVAVAMGDDVNERTAEMWLTITTPEGI